MLEISRECTYKGEVLMWFFFFNQGNMFLSIKYEYVIVFVYSLSEIIFF